MLFKTQAGCYRRLSLPASLLEPIPNLEYWHYLDRPDFYDPFLRMLAVLRFTFTKDLKFVVRVVGYFYIGTVSMVVCRSMERSSSPTILSLENISGPTGTSFPVFMFLMTPINLKRH